MTAPAVVAGHAPAKKARADRGVDRWGGLIEFYFRFHTVIVYIFLYLPIIVVVVFAFNGTDRVVTEWERLLAQVVRGGAAGRGRQDRARQQLHRRDPERDHRHGRRHDGGARPPARRPQLKMTFDTLTYMSVIVPEIVIALATLVLFATSFDFLKSTFGMKLNFGYPTIIAAHVLFNPSLVLLLVRARLSGMDRSLTEASADLFATPWRTFRQITFPQLLPAIVAGFLLSFTFSFDDYVITTFVSGPGSSTLPLFIFGQVRAA